MFNLFCFYFCRVHSCLKLLRTTPHHSHRGAAPPRPAAGVCTRGLHPRSAPEVCLASPERTPARRSAALALTRGRWQKALRLPAACGRGGRPRRQAGPGVWTASSQRPSPQTQGPANPNPTTLEKGGRARARQKGLDTSSLVRNCF